VSRQPLEIRTCRCGCGHTFPVYHRQGGGRVYYTIRCRGRYQSRMTRLAQQSERRQCLGCERLLPIDARPNREYCCKNCKRRTQMRRFRAGLTQPQEYGPREPWRPAVCTCGHKLHPIDFSTDALGRVHEHCTHCGRMGQAA